MLIKSVNDVQLNLKWEQNNQLTVDKALIDENKPHDSLVIKEIIRLMTTKDKVLSGRSIHNPLHPVKEVDIYFLEHPTHFQLEVIVQAAFAMLPKYPNSPYAIYTYSNRAGIITHLYRKHYAFMPPLESQEMLDPKLLQQDYDADYLRRWTKFKHEISSLQPRFALIYSLPKLLFQLAAHPLCSVFYPNTDSILYNKAVELNKKFNEIYVYGYIRTAAKEFEGYTVVIADNPRVIENPEDLNNNKLSKLNIDGLRLTPDIDPGAYELAFSHISQKAAEKPTAVIQRPISTPSTFSSGAAASPSAFSLNENAISEKAIKQFKTCTHCKKAERNHINISCGHIGCLACLESNLARCLQCGQTVYNRIKINFD